jgi:hypothetical protein
MAQIVADEVTRPRIRAVWRTHKELISPDVVAACAVTFGLLQQVFDALLARPLDDAIV